MVAKQSRGVLRLALHYKTHIRSESIITSMACSKMFIIMRVLKCNMNMHMFYIVKLFGNSKSLSLN
jgi:hypothetical protein